MTLTVSLCAECGPCLSVAWQKGGDCDFIAGGYARGQVVFSRPFISSAVSLVCLLMSLHSFCCFISLSSHVPSFLLLFHQFVFSRPFIPFAVSSVCLLTPLHSFCCFISLSSHAPSFLLLFLNISSILMHHCDNQSEMCCNLLNFTV